MATFDLVRMRSAYREAVPVLQAEGWEAEDIAAINPAIMAALESGDVGLLGWWAEWLSDKAASAWVPGCDGVAVVPSLSMAAESRILDAQWARKTQR